MQVSVSLISVSVSNIASRLLAAAFLAAAICACGDADGSLPRAKADADVTAAVDAFVDATVTVPQQPEFITLHSVMLLKHGKVIAERWLNGAGPEIPHIMYSISKTFTAAAAGFAVDEGLLDVDDRVVDFFPDRLPEDVSENLASMRVRDLMTMTCGQAREAANVYNREIDLEQAFLSAPVEYAPGTHFVYNTLGTYMVSAILQKVTGQKVVDYLDTRLFQPLGIEKPVWEESPQGINLGGTGLFIKTEDMAKMGQLLLDGGKWHGKQILSRDWVAQMTSKQVDNARPADKRPDWTQGYGYFMWLCTHGGVRADGSDGQYIIVLPEKDAVIVLTTSSNMYQPYLDLVWEYLYPIL